MNGRGHERQTQLREKKRKRGTSNNEISWYGAEWGIFSRFSSLSFRIRVHRWTAPAILDILSFCLPLNLSIGRCSSSSSRGVSPWWSFVTIKKGRRARMDGKEKKRTRSVKQMVAWIERKNSSRTELHHDDDQAAKGTWLILNWDHITFSLTLSLFLKRTFFVFSRFSLTCIPLFLPLTVSLHPAWHPYPVWNIHYWQQNPTGAWLTLCPDNNERRSNNLDREEDMRGYRGSQERRGGGERNKREAGKGISRVE